MGIEGGHYRYLNNLLALDRCRPSHPSAEGCRGPTPILVEALLPFICRHPDQLFAAFIHNGTTGGFQIGYDRSHKLKSGKKNHPSSIANPSVVSNYIAGEVRKGCMVGPLPETLARLVHFSPIGLVPKPHSDKFRLIVDLSYPDGLSVNDGICEEWCSLQYASVDNAVEIIQSCGPGTMLAKLDLKDAYRIIPVHPDDHYLLGITWKGGVYIDRSLPFGLRSAPLLFTAFSDMVAWAIHCQGVRFVMHYLDDFLLLGAPDSQEVAHSLNVTLNFLFRSGIPVATHKTEGPSTCLTFLGILIDTSLFQLRLPIEKLDRLKSLLTAWQGRRSCTRKQLESFVGHLAHAATVIRPGRLFLRSLFSSLSLAAKPHYFIRLNSAVKADLQWWGVFLQNWNGVSFFPQPSPSIHIYSDASGSFGCGAFDPVCGWFQLQWPTSWLAENIATKELLPVVIAAAVWGKYWPQKHVCFHCDNMAVVSTLNKCSGRDLALINQMRCLYFHSAVYGFHFSACHIAGSDNTAADTLSRQTIIDFSFIPQIYRVAIPPAITDLLLDKRPDWTSEEWTRLFALSLVKE
jgi:hypothetical protein